MEPHGFHRRASVRQTWSWRARRCDRRVGEAVDMGAATRGDERSVDVDDGGNGHLAGWVAQADGTCTPKVDAVATSLAAVAGATGSGSASGRSAPYR